MGNVLITGGAGFIGGHLTARLSAEGHNIIVVDNLSSGNLRNLSVFSDKLRFVNRDITDFDFIDKLIKETDVVFHLAALSRVLPSIENPKKCFNDNVFGVEIIAGLCSKYDKKLVFSSSREVYGDAKYLPVDEDHTLTPENPYGASKICGEKIIIAYSRCYGLKYANLRLANVYGERDFERVIPIFIEKTLNGEPLIVYGGKQIIDFVHVADVVDVLLKASDYDENITINVGSGKGTTLLDLAKLIQEIGHGTSKLILRKKRNGEVERFVAKIDNAKKLLKWAPETELKDGLTRLLYSGRKSELQ